MYLMMMHVITDQNVNGVDDDDLQVNGFGKEGLRLGATLHWPIHQVFVVIVIVIITIIIITNMLMIVAIIDFLSLTS